MSCTVAGHCHSVISKFYFRKHHTVFEFFVNFVIQKFLCIRCIVKYFQKLCTMPIEPWSHKKLFTSTALVSVLSSLTIWNFQQLFLAWNDKISKNNKVQQIVIRFKQVTTKRMAQRLEMLGLSYVYLKKQCESAKSTEEFIKWLKSGSLK